MACVVIRDRFGDCHAKQMYGEVNPERIRQDAGYVAHSIAIVDPGENRSSGAVHDQRRRQGETTRKDALRGRRGGMAVRNQRGRIAGRVAERRQ